MIEPVFMKAWAVSWLICSVCIERITHSRSACEPRCGNRSLISVPDFPCFVKPTNEPRPLSSAFCSWASCCPLVNDSGKGFPSRALSAGFQSKLSNCEGPPAMQRKITRLALTGKCGCWIAPRQSSGLVRPEDAAADASRPSMASAMPPSP
jgi:hypothetical protein